MLFLLPRVTVVLLAIFAALAAWRAWRQRNGLRLPPSRPLRRRRVSPGAVPLVPAAVLRGADRTWVVFTTSRCRVCHEVAERLRRSEPGSHVAEVDATRE